MTSVNVPAGVAATTWLNWNVTSYLQQQKAAGNNVVTLVLQCTAPGSNLWANFNSEESGAGIAPQLTVTSQ